MSSDHRSPLAQRGFSMFLVIMVMFAASMFVAAGFAAANGDLPLSGQSKDRKQAYAAAEAGLNFYLTHLNQDDQYWTYCNQAPNVAPGQPAPINQQWKPAVGTDPRLWRTIPGTSARYTIEVLPASGFSACDPNNQKSMIDTNTGTFRIQSTGESSKASGDKGERRTIVASFRRAGFLDFLYFTNYEDFDPAAMTPGTAQDNAYKYCAGKYRPARTSCDSNQEINFKSGDTINGPLHSNDSLMICGTPAFGRLGRSDPIEVTQSPNPLVNNTTCSGNNAKLNGILKSPAAPMDAPDSNHALQVIAQNGGDLFTGKTFIQLNGATMNVTTTVNGVRTYYGNMGMPADGVIYVQNDTGGTCTAESPAGAKYAEENYCGNVYVSGNYSGNLTIGADNDIIVAPTDGKVIKGGNAFGITQTASSDGVLGLIANNFIRIWHPVTSCANTYSTYDGKGLEIDAAMLSLKHSFMLDNNGCGNGLGTLKVVGAIAQEYRGAVGTTGGNGFTKDYEYDDRLRYRSPPHFLNPIDSAWEIVRSNELVPSPGN